MSRTSFKCAIAKFVYKSDSNFRANRVNFIEKFWINYIANPFSIVMLVVCFDNNVFEKSSPLLTKFMFKSKKKVPTPFNNENPRDLAEITNVESRSGNKFTILNILSSSLTGEFHASQTFFHVLVQLLRVSLIRALKTLKS